MKIEQAAIRNIAQTVLSTEGQEIIAPLEALWNELGVPDSMREVQQQVAELFAAQGLEVAFEVHLYVPEEDLPEHSDFTGPPAPAPLDLQADTLRALSIQQPWVERILTGQKNIEYRSFRTREAGPLLLHASGTRVPENFEAVGMESQIDRLPYRALVGVVDVVDVVPIEGEEKLYGWLLAHPRRFKKPIPYSGAAGIFRVPLAEVRAALRNLG